jgi:hypothetical protein
MKQVQVKEFLETNAAKSISLEQQINLFLDFLYKEYGEKGVEIIDIKIDSWVIEEYFKQVALLIYRAEKETE